MAATSLTLLGTCLCLIIVTTHVTGLFRFIPLCDGRRGFTMEQQKLCHKYREHMVQILIGGRLAKKECKKQMANRRWNCTFPKQPLSSFLHPPMPLATKETALVHSLIAAGTMHTISRACMENKLPNYCACSQERPPEGLPKNHFWTGCSDNLRYGARFSKQFINAKEEPVSEDIKSLAKTLTNVHNTEAGTEAVYDKSIIQCRCHGISSNCQTKTCHRQLGNFKEVGKRLQELYESSKQVKIEEKPGTGVKTESKLVQITNDYGKFTKNDLVYTVDSPSYCTKNLKIGSFGTRGRKCTKGTLSLNDCSILCCGRGHHTRREIIKEKCGCKFLWCCEVRCQACEKEQNVHYCK